MPTPPDGIPWLAWAIVVVVLALVAQIPVLVQQHRTKRDVQEVKDQVKNTHTTNLRVDLDSVASTAADAAADAKLAAESAHRVERHVEDLAKSLRAAEHSADRRYEMHVAAIEEVRSDLDKHLDAIPELTAAAVDGHVEACPLRRAHGS